MVYFFIISWGPVPSTSVVVHHFIMSRGPHLSLVLWTFSSYSLVCLLLKSSEPLTGVVVCLVSKSSEPLTRVPLYLVVRSEGPAVVLRSISGAEVHLFVNGGLSHQYRVGGGGIIN